MLAAAPDNSLHTTHLNDRAFLQVLARLGRKGPSSLVFVAYQELSGSL